MKRIHPTILLLLAPGMASAGLKGLLGSTLLAPDGNLVSTDVLGHPDGIGLYFSAHWCPPCRGFTPRAIESYKQLKEEGKKFEVVFLSSDRSVDEFKTYFASMPWHALPCDTEESKKKIQILAKKFRIAGIPTLVMVDGNGRLLTREGCTALMDDPDGKNFPWRPRSPWEIIDGPLVDNQGNETPARALRGHPFGVYFSGHWCAPCRGFTPKLVETYNKMKSKEKDAEIIFCSSDREETAFQEYFKEMPWKAFPFGDSRIRELARAFGISGIPALVTVDTEGKIVTKEGRRGVIEDPEGDTFPWPDPPVGVISQLSAQCIGDVPTMMILLETASEESVHKIMPVIHSFAESTLLESQETGNLPKMQFLKAPPGSSSDLLTRIRSIFDLGTSSPHIVLLDLAEGKKYPYEGDVTEEGLATFVSSFEAGTLQGVELESP